MPICQIHLIEGRSIQQKQQLISKITEAIVAALEARPETVRVILTEMPKDNFGIGGKSVAELGR